jgi:hypothetical protein
LPVEPAATKTVVLWVAVPAAPLHLSVNVVVLVRAPVDCDPFGPSVPLHPPDAEQELALLDDHVRIEAAPLATVVGFARNDRLGAAAATVTVTVCEAEPPLPVQDSVKFVVALNWTVACDPLVAFPPVQPPDAVQVVAWVAAHSRTDVAPALMVVGFAERATLGGVSTTETVAVLVAVPPLPVQDKA